MKKEIKKILTSMNVRDDKKNAEQKAYDLYKIAPDELSIFIELGLEFKRKPKDEKIKNFIRAIIFSFLIFYKKNKSAFTNSPCYADAIDLLIDLSSHGFVSAKTTLSAMEFSEYDIYRRQLLSLPEVEKHLHDEEISTREAYEEIRLSKGFKGFKGFLKDHYALGHDNKRSYDIYRIDKKLFSLRTHKTK